MAREILKTLQEEHDTLRNAFEEIRTDRAAQACGQRPGVRSRRNR